MRIDIQNAESQLLELGRMAWAGEVVVITKAGKSYLDLVPHRNSHVSRVPGSFEEQIYIPDDFNETTEDIDAVFMGL